MTHPYATQAYALSLGHVGEALAAPEWSGHVLVRPIPATGQFDGVGPYPLTVIPADADIAGGLRRMAAAGLVSVVLVLDDRLRPSLEALSADFDFVRPFKSHYLHDRSVGAPAYSKHHRYEIRRALSQVEATEIDLADHLDAWEGLYRELAARHGMSGVHAFRADHHRALAKLEGVRTFGAFIDGRLVAAHIFVVADGYAISHLAASAPEGYAAGAAYAVNDCAVQALTGCDAINFGGGAGLGDDASDGLVRFKKGFSNTTAPSYLCGKVLNDAAYGALAEGFEAGAFFPAYRGRRTGTD